MTAILLTNDFWNSWFPEKTNMHPIRIGTCGWSYKEWSGVFYPRGMKPGEYLSYYSEQFDSVELDTTFHAVPPPERVRRWASVTPKHFQFCVKAPRADFDDHSQHCPACQRITTAWIGATLLDSLRSVERPGDFCVGGIRQIFGKSRPPSLGTSAPTCGRNAPSRSDVDFADFSKAPLRIAASMV